MVIKEHVTQCNSVLTDVFLIVLDNNGAQWTKEFQQPRPLGSYCVSYIIIIIMNVIIFFIISTGPSRGSAGGPLFGSDTLFYFLKVFVQQKSTGALREPLSSPRTTVYLAILTKVIPTHSKI